MERVSQCSWCVRLFRMLCEWWNCARMAVTDWCPKTAIQFVVRSVEAIIIVGGFVYFISTVFSFGLFLLIFSRFFFCTQLTLRAVTKSSTQVYYIKRNKVFLNIVHYVAILSSVYAISHMLAGICFIQWVRKCRKHRIAQAPNIMDWAMSMLWMECAIDAKMLPFSFAS